MEIEGFLFKPADVSKPVPAVVYPHGGPTSVYGDEWDGHAQYFIDKGYAWLAINFRGSTTYGVAFERANHDDWGIGDAADCIAAGRFLQSLQWVDEERLAIFGASYGSYMALVSLVHEENPFACGVAKYGDCNILTSWAQGDRPGGDDLERMMGHPSSNREAYRAGSPIHEIDKLDRPILIGHGEKDARVHLNQAQELVAELERLGKRYEYVTYPDEGHGFLRRPSQIDFYKRLERFLDWYLM
jgi:dipeptidyl aminopeptidase/acylaminoacyl peptidase